jgi:hypothetical protein
MPNRRPNKTSAGFWIATIGTRRIKAEQRVFYSGIGYPNLGRKPPHDPNPAEVLYDIGKAIDVFIDFSSPTEDRIKLPQGFG